MKDNKGALLITIIVFLTMAGILGSSIGYFLQNVPYAIKSVNTVEQSYYLAESGLRYAIMENKDEKDYDELRAIYEYGKREVYIPKKAASTPQTDLAGKFRMEFSRASFHNSKGMFIHSYAEIEKKARPYSKNPLVQASSKRQLNLEYRGKNNFDLEFKLEHFDQNKSENKRVWNLTDTFFAANTKKLREKNILQLKSNSQWNWVLASLNWGKSGEVDLREYQNAITKVLSYMIQININCYPYPNHQKDKDFMAGLNFRVMNDSRYKPGRESFRERIAYYGISLFKSGGKKQGNPPCWLMKDLSESCNQLLGDSFIFQEEGEKACEDPNAECLVPNVPYVIFWIKRENREEIELLAYSDLRNIIDNKGNYVFIKKLKPLDWGFREWLNIGVFLKEIESAGQKINELQVGLRLGDINNSEKKTDWTYPSILRFVKVSHSDPGSSTILSDRNLLSVDLRATDNPPDEIGFHALYDNTIPSSKKYNIEFKSFRLDCYGADCTETTERITQF